MSDQATELPTCPVCLRLHYKDDACPRRVAQAILSPTQRHLEALNSADKDAVRASHDIDLVDMLEEVLVEEERV